MQHIYLTDVTGLRSIKRNAYLLLGIFSITALSMTAQANALGENAAWQFATSQDRVNKGAIVDLIERKKGGYYDSFRTQIYNNSTNYTTIDRQVNCSVSAMTTGNSGTNATTAHTSSPSVSSSGATNANSSANSASNGLNQGTQYAAYGTAPGNAVPSSNGIDNNQSNAGNLSASVNGSSTSSSNGAVTANGGTSDQVLNSQQHNAGSSLAAGVHGSTACTGPLNGN